MRNFFATMMLTLILLTSSAQAAIAGHFKSGGTIFAPDVLTTATNSPRIEV